MSVDKTQLCESVCLAVGVSPRENCQAFAALSEFPSRSSSLQYAVCLASISHTWELIQETKREVILTDNVDLKNTSDFLH